MRYSILEKINSPSDLKALDKKELALLCEEIRSFLIEATCNNGGHLASNLGIVEATVALHRIFDSPKDRIIFDVGHQSYVHKLITGRREGFADLRVPGGMSGFTKREESEYDPFGAGHSSTALSAALGFAEADKLLGGDRHTVAVIGDGAFTGGMVHEALNNVKPDLPIVIVLNENGMSISQNKGAFASYLSRFRASQRYQRVKSETKKLVLHIPLVGKLLKSAITFIKKKIKNVILPINYFEELGLQYIGPIDGNDYFMVEKTLSLAKALKKPVVVHLHTVKGKGYLPAERSPSDYHSVINSSKASSFHEKASEFLIDLAEQNEKIVAVTAAMGMGTGLELFEKRFPDRYFDVGIAEAHALTFSAGLCAGGLSPYVAIYSTFLQRGYDNILHDIALQKLPVRILVDRAGLSLSDGATHHGIFDVAFLLHIPNIRLFAPINYASLKRILTLTENCEDAVAVRYSNSSDAYFISEGFNYVSESPTSLILADFDLSNIPDRLFVCYGRIVGNVISAKSILRGKGEQVGIIVIESLTPDRELLNKLSSILSMAKRVLLVEEGILNGGFASTVYQKLGAMNFDFSKTKVEIAAIDDNFASPDKVCDLYDYVGLSPEKLVGRINDESV